MTKRKKIILLIIVLAVIAGIAYGVNAMSGGSVVSAPLASPQTKLALNKNFSKALNAHIGVPDDATPLQIQQGSSQAAMNVLVYVLSAYQDYQAGHISKAQMLEIMRNTKGSIEFIENSFNPANSKVLSYPIQNTSIGNSYIETEANGVQNGNAVKFVQLQPKIFDLINQMYSEKTPEKIYTDLQQIGVMMEQGTFYFSSNMQFGLDKITIAQFRPTWITGNTLVTPDSIQTTLTQISH